jgi:hypothetical protein
VYVLTEGWEEMDESERNKSVEVGKELEWNAGKRIRKTGERREEKVIADLVGFQIPAFTSTKMAVFWIVALV